jgi:hypothetical protein
MDFELRRRMAAVIEAVLSGQMSATAAVEQLQTWPPAIGADPVLFDAYHALVHFREDEDIRGKDGNYQRAQEAWLLGFVQRLTESQSSRQTSGPIEVAIPEEPIQLELNRHEALVLFDWLLAFDETDLGPPLDSAERVALWRLEGKLEERLVEILMPNYKELLDNARKRLLSSSDADEGE